MKSIPQNVCTDQGGEYYNKPFQNLMSHYKINHYSKFSHKKSSIAERVILTLKKKNLA